MGNGYGQNCLPFQKIMALHPLFGQLNRQSLFGTMDLRIVLNYGFTMLLLKCALK